MQYISNFEIKYLNYSRVKPESVKVKTLWAFTTSSSLQ